MNIFTPSYRKKWYIKHPILAAKHLIYDIQAAYRRITRGWANRDAYDMDIWFLNIIPAMLRHLATSYSYPDKKFTSLEEWHAWLIEQATNLEHCRNDDPFFQNEWREQYSNLSLEDPTYKEVRDKYWAREKEIHATKEDLVRRTLTNLSIYFFDLWS